MADHEPHAAEVLPFPRADWERNANALKGKLDEGLVTTDRDVRCCQHAYSQVNGQARTLTCRDCGAALDPIDVLAEIARRRESLVFELGHLASERKRMREEVAELRREERNAKGRIRNARRQARGLDAAAVSRAAVLACGHYRRTGPLLGGAAYRAWDELSEEQRTVVRRYVEAIVEVYVGELEAAAVA